ncbi:cytochrome c oxidase subunit 7A1, mitochondrial-like [Phascolarctos cinereus]|uniref:Cytochrome c oxidase subunit 7A1, mitochondrial n=1 Tax=Phascolarctos cinereus TaxID=38626 RepID=A0A6P5JQW3_PHACI|nr:cytochrome c oxidase subunit 7A1, mitochondrial-like [Phascolarctos cinereus]
MRGLLVSHSRTLIRPFSSSARNHIVNKVPEKQKLFQENNDLPVHLKGGAKDHLLYRITMAICLGGASYSLFYLGWASFPHKK